MNKSIINWRLQRFAEFTLNEVLDNEASNMFYRIKMSNMARHIGGI